MFISGVTLIIGPQKTFFFFFQRRKWKGTACFIIGLFLVFIKHPIIGILIEVFGFVNLFGDFFPVILSFLTRLPVIGPWLTGGPLKSWIDRILGAKLPL